MGELSMSPPDREAFLADLHVGVLTVERADGAPLATPIWYRFAGGLVEFTIEERSQKAQLLRAAGRATLCAQREQVPYAYVTVDGPVALTAADDEVRRDIAVRYLGVEAGTEYLATAGHTDEVLVQLTPERWHTLDFGKQG